MTHRQKDPERKEQRTRPRIRKNPDTIQETRKEVKTEEVEATATPAEGTENEEATSKKTRTAEIMTTRIHHQPERRANERPKTTKTTREHTIWEPYA